MKFFRDFYTRTKKERRGKPTKQEEVKGETKGRTTEVEVERSWENKDLTPLILKGEVHKALITVKKRISTRSDGMKNEVLRILADTLAPFMAKLCFVSVKRDLHLRNDTSRNNFVIQKKGYERFE